MADTVNREIATPRFKAERVHQCWVALCDPIWQVTLRSSEMGVLLRAISPSLTQAEKQSTVFLDV